VAQPLIALMPAQSGADVTSQNTAADTAQVNGVASHLISPISGLMPSQAGADVTSQNTSAYTASLGNQSLDTLPDGGTYVRVVGVDGNHNVTSAGIPPNIRWNTGNQATVTATYSSGFGYGWIDIYGPGGVGTSWTFLSAGGAITYPGAQINGLSAGVTYYVVFDASTLKFVVTNTFADVLGDYFIVITSITVPSGSGSASGGGGNGGGHGTF
jgi:hypothetical protein